VVVQSVVAIVLVVAAVVAFMKIRQSRAWPPTDIGSPPVETQSWPTLSTVAQIQPGSRLLIGWTVYTVVDYERLGLTSVAPAYLYALSCKESRVWLFVQTGLNSQEAWLLDDAGWTEAEPTQMDTHLFYGLSHFGDAVWQAVSSYPQDGIQPSGSMVTYALYFEDPAARFVPYRRRLLMFEWREGGMAVRLGSPVDLRQVKLG